MGEGYTGNLNRREGRNERGIRGNLNQRGGGWGYTGNNLTLLLSSLFLF